MFSTIFQELAFGYLVYPIILVQLDSLRISGLLLMAIILMIGGECSR